MHPATHIDEKPPTTPKKKTKRSRFTSSNTPNPVSELHARLNERKAALSTKENNDTTEQHNSEHKNLNSGTQVPTEPAPKRRRTRFSKAKGQQSSTESVNNAASSTKPRLNNAKLQPSSTTLGSSSPLPSEISLDINAIPVAPQKTLRINQIFEKKQKLEPVLKTTEDDFLDTNPQSNPYFDPLLRKPPREARPLRKDFNFIDQGTIAAQAQYDRQCAVIQARRDEFTAKLTDTSQTSDLPVLPPLAEDLSLPSEVDVPQTEWWDLPFLVRSESERELKQLQQAQNLSSAEEAVSLKKYAQNKTSDNITTATNNNQLQDIRLREERITHYIHHPIPIESVKPQKSPPVMKLMLTKNELKKLRRQRRMETQKEQQEMIAAGLLPPLPPKVKLSNMMRVLTTETSVDPTKVEAEVRAQVEARRSKHEADNAERKKSGEERREKVRQKRQKDRDAGLHACVFRVTDLSFAPHRFKVDRNAKQLEMTGIMVLFPNCNIVVVEGGAKALKKYKTLMLRRINWGDASKLKRKAREQNKETDNDKDDEADSGKSGCTLVWEGVISSKSFKSFEIKKMNDEEACRNLFNSCHVEHYWDLCLQASPLGNEKLGVRQL